MQYQVEGISFELAAEVEKRISFTPPAKLAGTPILHCAVHDETVNSFGRNDKFGGIGERTNSGKDKDEAG